MGEEFFLALCHVALSQVEEAIGPLEHVLASNAQLPDALMAKYRIGGLLQVQVTPFTVLEMPMSSLAAALLLAEAYQASRRPDDAMHLLESLGAISPDVGFALSLAELYTGEDRWDDVLRVTEDFTENSDDPTCELLSYRGQALRMKAMSDAALESFREALRSKKRNPALLRLARYGQALAHEAKGRRSQARKDFERIYAEDPEFADVAARLDLER